MRRYGVFLGVFLSMGCGEVFESEESAVTTMPGYQTRVFALDSPCMVNVEGVGMVDIENDYIPGVVACENGNAPYEALKAQAVQARGFLYYKLFVAGETTIRNSQADQVYSCSYRPNGPDEIHRRAAQETKGQYLVWNDRIIAPFYVAGAIPPSPDPNDPIASCRGNGGADATNTERFVTYNWGRAGCNSQMTSLGWVPDDCNRNPHNRGCASQNGESCLARQGWKYQDMFDYYYGADIQLLSGTGTCGGPPPYVLTDQDRFCGLKADASYCFDAATRVQCTGEFASATQVCPGECVEGVCTGGEEPTEETCLGQTDGAFCLDNVTRVECSSSDLVLTETCTLGCSEGECLAPTDPQNPGPGTDPIEPGPTLNQGFPGLVSPSATGTSESCATAGVFPTWLMVLLMLGYRRRITS